MDLSHFVSSVTPSATLEFNKKALELARSGEDVVKFTAGEPDFPTPRPIVDAAIKALNEGKTKYTNAAGIDELRQAIALKLQKENNMTYSPEEIVVANGGKQAIYNVLKALVNVGDEVIIISPAWVSYEAQILLVVVYRSLCRLMLRETSFLRSTKLRVPLPTKRKRL